MTNHTAVREAFLLAWRQWCTTCCTRQKNGGSYFTTHKSPLPPPLVTSDQPFWCSPLFSTTLHRNSRCCANHSPCPPPTPSAIHANHAEIQRGHVCFLLKLTNHSPSPPPLVTSNQPFRCSPLFSTTLHRNSQCGANRSSRPPPATSAIDANHAEIQRGHVCILLQLTNHSSPPPPTPLVTSDQPFRCSPLSSTTLHRNSRCCANHSPCPPPTPSAIHANHAEIQKGNVCSLLKLTNHPWTPPPPH